MFLTRNLDLQTACIWFCDINGVRILSSNVDSNQLDGGIMKKGFTLIEMVLVMAVIVVLLLLTMPNIQRTLNVINEKGCDAQLKIIDAAILQWQLKYDGVPVSIQDLVTDEFITERQTRCSDGKNIEIVQGQATIQ